VNEVGDFFLTFTGLGLAFTIGVLMIYLKEKGG
jgi:hypothetical protein